MFIISKQLKIIKIWVNAIYDLQQKKKNKNSLMSLKQMVTKVNSDKLLITNGELDDIIEENDNYLK